MNLPEKQKKKQEEQERIRYRHYDGEKLVLIGVALFFTGLFTSVFFAFQTLIGLFDLFKILSLFVALSYAVVSLFFRSIFPMKTMEKLSLAFFGFTPLACGLFFLLNYFISLESQNYAGTISKLKSGRGGIRFETSNFPCEDYPEACVISISDIEKAYPSRGDSIYIETSKGLFGYTVMKDITWIDLDRRH